MDGIRDGSTLARRVGLEDTIREGIADGTDVNGVVGLDVLSGNLDDGVIVGLAVVIDTGLFDGIASDGGMVDGVDDGNDGILVGVSDVKVPSVRTLTYCKSS